MGGEGCISEKTREVKYKEYEYYDEEVIKYRDVTQYRDFINSRKVVREHDVIKHREEDVYTDRVDRKLDQAKYGTDIQNCNNKIINNRKAIEHDIQNDPKGQLGVHNKEPILPKDEIEEKYQDIMSKWQDAEYEAYFAANPTNSLAELDVQTIGDSL